MLSSFERDFLLEITPRQQRSSRMIWLSFWAEVREGSHRRLLVRPAAVESRCPSRRPVPPSPLPPCAAPLSLSSAQVHYNSLYTQNEPPEPLPRRSTLACLLKELKAGLRAGGGGGGSGGKGGGKGGGVQVIEIE